VRAEAEVVELVVENYKADAGVELAKYNNKIVSLRV